MNAPRPRPARLPCAAFAVLLAAAGAVSAGTPAGWVEWVTIGPGALRVEAKLDTGADNSSLHAESVEGFERAGQRWVRFSVAGAGGERRTLEQPVARVAKVRTHGEGARRRDVVRLELCLGSVRRTVEVSLADRAGFRHPLLLGRSFLAGAFLVDSGATHLLSATCEAR